MNLQLSDKVALVSGSTRSKLYSLAACLAALSLFGGCSFNSGLKGSGIVKTESRAVSNFSSISSESVGRVTVQRNLMENTLFDQVFRDSEGKQVGYGSIQLLVWRSSLSQYRI